jgi:hypothetical protein
MCFFFKQVKVFKVETENSPYNFTLQRLSLLNSATLKNVDIMVQRSKSNCDSVKVQGQGILTPLPRGLLLPSLYRRPLPAA